MIDSLSDDGGFHVVLEVTSHETLTELLQTINETDGLVQTRQITEASISGDTTVSIDLSILTETQRETLALALEEGYYERPRGTDLAALSDRLDISKSAVSQRLRNAEIKLITHALEPYR